MYDPSLFSFHFNRFFWAFSCTNAATLAELKIYVEIAVYAGIRAVHHT